MVDKVVLELKIGLAHHAQFWALTEARSNTDGEGKLAGMLGEGGLGLQNSWSQVNLGSPGNQTLRIAPLLFSYILLCTAACIQRTDFPSVKL